MKRIYLLTAAAVVLAAISQPSLAASRTHRADPAATDQLDQVRRDYYSVYGNTGQDAFARGEGRTTYQVAPSHNLPYADRPWGAPDKD